MIGLQVESKLVISILILVFTIEKNKLEIRLICVLIIQLM